MENVNENNKKITELKNNNTNISFQDPHKIIFVDNALDRIDIEKYGVEYQKLKEENKIKSKEEWKIRYQNINSILTIGELSKENWIKINKIILQNKKSKIWRETANVNRITEDFKKLYKHTNEIRLWKNEDIAETIKTILLIIQANIDIYDKNRNYILQTQKL